MKKYLSILLSLLFLMLCSCASAHHAAEVRTIEQRDSITVKTETVFVTDTVLVEIPAQTAERETRDSTSQLENDYSVSVARINPDGSLFHDLKTKPQKKAVEIQKPVERKDSIVYRDRQIEVPVSVERELGWWEKTSIQLFPASLAALLLTAICLFRKQIIELIRRYI